MEPPGQTAGLASGQRDAAQVAARLVESVRDRLVRGRAASASEVTLYAYVVMFLLYQRYAEDLHQIHVAATPGRGRIACYRRYSDDLHHFLGLGAVELPGRVDPAHLFACFFQIRRAFKLIFQHIIGGSAPAAALRATVWQSIFTHGMRRYRRTLYQRMRDVTTLVTGPSGTGKELVERATALSTYIPFDSDREMFVTTPERCFHPLNLSALSPTLIESGLFGHRKGAFTGGLQDRSGWLEACPQEGTVLLDEIGELDPSIQVKLLRVLQTRTFQRIGETEPRQFRGRLIAATNRDLGDETRAGRFREDLYCRLCSDLIVTPSLREQLRESPEELRHLVRFVSERVIGPDEAEELTDEVLQCVAGDLGPDYPWPGNVRELEQCVRNVLVRRRHQPSRQPDSDAVDAFTLAVREGDLTAKTLLTHYCTLVYHQTGSYQETARRLEFDRRTVSARPSARGLRRTWRRRS